MTIDYRAPPGLVITGWGVPCAALLDKRTHAACILQKTTFGKSLSAPSFRRAAWGETNA